MVDNGPVVFTTFKSGKFQLSVSGGNDGSIGARAGLTIGAAVKATSARRLDFVLLAG